MASKTQDLVFRTDRPTYGTDYGLGWIGFNHAESNMSAMIAHFERWHRTSDIVISHVFVVTGANECIEAAFPDGVVETNLQEAYFDRDDRYVVFRQPKSLRDDVARRIAETARRQVGANFDHSELVNHAAQNNFVGWLLNTLSRDALRNGVDRFMDADDEWICSELAAYCLNQQPEFAGRGVLSHSLGAITPQQLFEDEEIFEPFPDD